MTYYDHTSDSPAITLLTEINGQYVKMPLNDYNILTELLNDNKTIETIMEYNTINLQRVINQILAQEKIPLGQLMQSKYLFDKKKQNKYAYDFKKRQIYDFELYVTTDPYGGSIVERRMFTPSGILDHNNADDDSMQEYKYKKNATCNLVANGVKRGLSLVNINRNKRSNNYDYEFEVEIPEGTVGYKELETKDGRILLQQVLMIPGIHRYHVVYGKCEDLGDYRNSGRAETIKVFATRNQLKDDLHDTPKAFRLGCAQDLPMELYDINGKVLNNSSRRSYR